MPEELVRSEDLGKYRQVASHVVSQINTTNAHTHTVIGHAVKFAYTYDFVLLEMCEDYSVRLM